MRALILACFLLASCGTEGEGMEVAGTPQGCPAEEIDLTVPQTLVFCGEEPPWQSIVDTAEDRCYQMSDGKLCTEYPCEVAGSGALVYGYGSTTFQIDCAGLHTESHDWPHCTKAYTLPEKCLWLTE